MKLLTPPVSYTRHRSGAGQVAGRRPYGETLCRTMDTCTVCQSPCTPPECARANAPTTAALWLTHALPLWCDVTLTDMDKTARTIEYEAHNDQKELIMLGLYCTVVRCVCLSVWERIRHVVFLPSYHLDYVHAYTT